MASASENHSSVIDESIARLISRAGDSRGLEIADVRSRVSAAVNKYLGDEPGNTVEVRSFIDELHADDLCLILACERGDAAAWEHLVKHFDQTVKSAARRISSNSEDAEDLASSIWAELYGLRQDADGRKKSKLAYYSGRGSLAGWLRAVVSQLAVDEYRKQSKYVQIEEDREFENLANDADADGHELASHSPDPEELLTETRTSGDVSTALSAAIAELEPEDRLILKLYYFDDLKLKDIAAMFGFHEATASRRLTRLQSDIRKGVERHLRTQHGWTESEVKRHLSDTAARLGVDLQTMFAMLIAAAFAVQDLLG